MTTPKKTKEIGKNQRPIKPSESKKKKSVENTTSEVKAKTIKKSIHATKSSNPVPRAKAADSALRPKEQPKSTVSAATKAMPSRLMPEGASTTKLSHKKIAKKTTNKTAGLTTVVDYESRLRLIRARHEAMQDDTEAFADEIEVADVADVEPEPEPENEAGPEEE